MSEVINLTPAWSDHIDITDQSLVQAQGSSVYLDFSADDPAADAPGYLLQSGDAVIVPAGNVMQARVQYGIRPLRLLRRLLSLGRSRLAVDPGTEATSDTIAPSTAVSAKRLLTVR